MADFIVSTVAERAVSILEGQIRDKIKLLTGVEDEVRSLSEELKRIGNVLDDAERRGHKDRSVKDWLRRLESTSHEIDGVLDEWEFAICKHQIERAAAAHGRKVWSSIPSRARLSYNKLSVRHDIAKKLKRAKAKLDEILVEKDRYGFDVSQPANPSVGPRRLPSTSFVKVDDIHGRDRDRDHLLGKLIPKGSELEASDTQIISMVGLGGIGKTTLAQMVYNDNRVKDCYPFRIWICVSSPFDIREIAKGIVQKVQGSCPDTCQLDLLLECLRDCILGKKFLLVLDDVWTENSSEWDPLKNCLDYGGKGSKVLVTTRKERVAYILGTERSDMHFIGKLSHEDCWLLLSRIALPGRNVREIECFKEVGKRVAEKCNGLPLAAKALGSLLLFKHTVREWRNVLESKVWELEEAEIDIFPHLFLSFNDLSPSHKRCFSYCSVFPKDHVIDVESLIRSWVALGYLDSKGTASELELRGRECFDKLAMLSLFQEFERDKFNEVIVKCKMHDILHDFAQFLRKDEGDDGGKTSCQVCSPSSVSIVKKYRSLFYHKEPIPDFCNCLVSLRLLSLRCCSLEIIPNQIVKLIHLRHLDLSENEKFKGEGLEYVCKLYNLKALLVGMCNLQEIPMEIGHLTRLRHLDLSQNRRLLRLPESIGHLHELRTLDVSFCRNLHEFPQGNHRLTNLRHLHIDGAFCEEGHFPDKAIGQLASLCTLGIFKGKLRYLKNLNQISGELTLFIQDLKDEEVADNAKGAELHKKEHIQILNMVMECRVCRYELDELEPHPRLAQLTIDGYQGSELSNWIASPLNQLRRIEFSCFSDLTSLPPLGKLQCLEDLTIIKMSDLQLVGRDFLGLTTTAMKNTMDVASSSSSSATDIFERIMTTGNRVDTGMPSSVATRMTTVFPMLKRLRFFSCRRWTTWEDITPEEEHSTALSFFPCLEFLSIRRCNALTILPLGLFRKAPSSVQFDIDGM